MQILILRLLLRRVILSLAVLLALAFLNVWMYPALGLVVAIAIMPILYPQWRAKGQLPHQYALVFLISFLTWPDSILTQSVRARNALRGTP